MNRKNGVMIVMVKRVGSPLDCKKSKATLSMPTTNDGIVAFIVQQE
jgi:hypothetical protein